MNAVLAPTAPIQVLTFLAINSAPLSDRMNSGGPRSMNRSVNASTTSVELSLRLTFMVGMPPVKWSAHWDMIVPFLGGLNDGWKARETRRYCAEASSS